MSSQARSTTSDDELLRAAVARIVERFSPKRIVLFGSRAWGEPSSDSDYDLLVLVDEPVDVRRLAGKIRWEIAHVPASFDIVVRRVDWWNQWCDTPFSLERRIEQQGLELHAA